MARAGETRDDTDADTHLSILAALNFLGGGFVLLAGLFVAWGVWFGVNAATAWMGPFAWFFPEAFQSIVLIFVFAAILLALPAILAGIGLSQRKEYGRVLTFVVAGGVALFALASFTLVPIAYSAYAFWVLTRENVKTELKTGQQPRGA